jgi:hypothetical protein
MLSRFFAAEGTSFEKSVRASEPDCPDVAERRKAWRRAQMDLGDRLDEIWTTAVTTRRYAGADVGTLRAQWSLENDVSCRPHL